MPTKKKRLNITLPKQMAVFLEKIAIRDEVPQATKAVELIDKALELEEDRYFSAIANERDTPDATYVPHDKAWK